MYDVEKRSTVLANVIGFTRLYAYIYTVPDQNGSIGVCLYIGKTNFAFPRMLYESKCH